MVAEPSCSLKYVEKRDHASDYLSAIEARKVGTPDKFWTNLLQEYVRQTSQILLNMAECKVNKKERDESEHPHARGSRSLILCVMQSMPDAWRSTT